MIKVSGVIITYNEEHNIEECILSLRDIVDEVLVVDSYSTDKTKDICQKLGVIFHEHNFEGHIEQKNYAMQLAKYDHILSLDADERLSAQMKDSIALVKTSWEADGYIFNRLNNYCGSWLKHSWYPDSKLRLWDRRKGKWGGTNPHDKVIVSGKVTKLKGDILHYAYRTLEEHFEQVKKFAIIAAHAKHRQGKKPNFLIHIIIGPWFRFIKRYVFRFGFLDGYYGFIFCVLSSYLNFMKYTRLWELNRRKGD